MSQAVYGTSDIGKIPSGQGLLDSGLSESTGAVGDCDLPKAKFPEGFYSLLNSRFVRVHKMRSSDYGIEGRGYPSSRRTQHIDDARMGAAGEENQSLPGEETEGEFVRKEIGVEAVGVSREKAGIRLFKGTASRKVFQDRDLRRKPGYIRTYRLQKDGISVKNFLGEGISVVLESSSGNFFVFQPEKFFPQIYGGILGKKGKQPSEAAAVIIVAVT